MKMCSIFGLFISLLVFTLVFASCENAVLARELGNQSAGDGGGLNTACWMGQYQTNLWNIALSNLVILGSHDADSGFINSSCPACIGYESNVGHTINYHPTAGDLNVARCQSASISNQLYAGVRWLDMRVAYQQGVFYSEHMWLAGPFESTSGVVGIFDQINQFLSDNPDEIIILNTQQVHIYSDSTTTTNGLATQDQIDAFFQEVKDNLPLIPAPTSNPMQVTLGSIWSGPGRVIYVGPTNLSSELQSNVWVNLVVDSTWYSDALDMATLMPELTDNMKRWCGSYNDQFHVLQAMLNDTNKITNARTVANPAIYMELAFPTNTSWQHGLVNVIQMNDSVCADGSSGPSSGSVGMVTTLLERMGISNGAEKVTVKTPIAGDFDGDGKADPAIYAWTNTVSGRLHGWLSSATYLHIASAASFHVGLDEMPAFADFDGDNYHDLGVFNRREGKWYIWLSSAGYSRTGPLMFSIDGNDIPVAADYDGDGKADPAVCHGGDGVWYIWPSSADYVRLGPLGQFHVDAADVIPAPGDYDGDGKADPALYDSYNGAWHFWLSGSGYAPVGPVSFRSSAAHMAAPGDYDGDGKCDPATYVPSSGKWRIWLSGSSYSLIEQELR